MWQTILQILAIIGIIVLVLAGILILLTCLVLFAPVRYRLKGEIDTTTKEYSGSGKATWLFHIFSATIEYPEPGTVKIKFFGYPIKVISLGETEESQEPQEPADIKDTKDTVDDAAGEEISRAEQGSTSVKESTECAPKESFPDKELSFDKEENEKNEKNEKNGKSIFVRWYDKIVYTITALCDKIKKIWNTIRYYKDILEDKQTSLFWDRSKRRIFRLLKAIRPRRICGNLRVGTGSPDTTGYLLAVYGMLVPYIDKRFTLEPDFEEAVCVGNLTAKGRIFLWTVLVVILGFATDKYIPVLQKKLKREEQ